MRPPPRRGCVMRVEELAKTLDHTVLKPRARRDDVERACRQAREHHFATVCSQPAALPLVVERLRGSDVKAATVVAFPFGAELPGTNVAAAELAVRAGADELDLVMNVSAMLSGDWGAVRHGLVSVVRAVRACDARGTVMVKIIIEAPHLDDKHTRLACRIVAESGADFASTATGVGTVASVHDVELMREALPEHVAVKAAGGIRTLEMAEDLINAGAARLGTSSAVAIVQELAALGGVRR